MSSESRAPARFALRPRAAVGDRRGTAAIEFSVVMAAIVVIVLGTYDIGNYVLQEMKLADAAHVGGQYAISYPSDTAGMTEAVNAALPPAWISAIGSPTITCACGTSSPTDQVVCSAPCPAGEPERFVTITLQLNYTLLSYTPLNYAPLLLTNILTPPSATYVARVQ